MKQRMMLMSYNIALYIRVSTEEQAMRTEGSLDSQKHRLSGFVDIKNMQQTDWGKVIESYVDEGLSAKDTNRPALQRLMRDLKNGRVNMVLVTDISRLSRSIRDFCGLIDMFKETKTQFLSLKEQFDTTTAAGEMMLFNMINLAQFERRQISERVMLNFHSRAMRGLRNGGSTVLGFKIDPTNKSILTANKNEVPLVKTVFEIYINEGSLNRTAAKLREMNIQFQGNAGTSWNVQTLSNLLRNQSYIGMREVNKGNKDEDQNELKSHEKYQTVKAAWPAIIDETTFFTVQKMLDENYKNERQRLQNSKSRVFLASGISTCSECGRALVGSTGHGRLSETRYYIHRPIEGKTVTCSTKRIRAEDVEDVIVNHLLNVINREGYLDGIESAVAKSLLCERDSLVILKNDSAKKVLELDSDLKKLIKLQMQAEDTDLNSIYNEQLLELKIQRQKERELFENLENQLQDTLDPKAVRESVEVNMKRLQLAWAKATPRIRKSLLRTVIDRLVFKSDCIEIFYRPIVSNSQQNQNTKLETFTGANPVDLSEVRKSKKQAQESHFLNVGNQANNAKFSGWYNVKIGCGNRI